MELVSCVVFHLSRRPWKFELLTVSMLEIVLAVGEEIDSLDDVMLCNRDVTKPVEVYRDI